MSEKRRPQNLMELDLKSTHETIDGLLTIIKVAMPEHLRKQDIRVQRGEELRDLFRWWEERANLLAEFGREVTKAYEKPSE